MSRAARYVQIANDIRNQIESSVLLPGQAIPTVRELAREYGVTTQTVAKATRHLAEAGLIETRHGAGSRVSIRPGLLHRSQRTSRTLVTLVHAELLTSGSETGAIANQWFDASLNAITRVAGALELKTQVLGFGVHNRVPAEPIVRAIETALGVLVLGDPPDSYTELLRDAEVPVCFFNRPVPDALVTHAVSVRAGVQRFGELVDYVLSLGHTRLLYAWDTDPEYANAEVGFRRSILNNRLRDWGLDPALALANVDISSRNAQAGVSDLIEGCLKSGCTAAVCYNDATAIRLYRILHYIGARIPDDISVVGFDGVPSGELLFPPLSTVKVDMVSVAQQALQSIQLINEGLPYQSDILVPGELTIRRSATVPHNTTGA